MSNLLLVFVWCWWVWVLVKFVWLLIKLFIWFVVVVIRCDISWWWFLLIRWCVRWKSVSGRCWVVKRCVGWWFLFFICWGWILLNVSMWCLGWRWIFCCLTISISWCCLKSWLKGWLKMIKFFCNSWFRLFLIGRMILKYCFRW